MTITDVDDGSTVTDFLPAERARGITIQSAAITFSWPSNVPDSGGINSDKHQSSVVEFKKSEIPHTINLIDTPGHADFTFEVLRSLRVLDGAVCILDGVAGVEAQTEKVWYQAGNYQIPKIIYVNKLDRDGSAFGRTVKEIATRLHAWPAVCQIPWYQSGDSRFIGVVDVVNLRALRWADDGDGKEIKSMHLGELGEIDGQLEKEIRKARTALVELLSEYDDLIVEKYLECNEDHMAISPSDVINSLRRCLLVKPSFVVPVFAGASFRNIGVQPLLDAVVKLLPNPNQCHDPEISIGKAKGGLNELLNGKLLYEQGDLLTTKRKGMTPIRKSTAAVINDLEACALAFKVVNDFKRGVLIYVRVYYGSINRNALLFNTNLQISERAPRLLKMYASDAVEVNSITAGQIGVITGLKHARTGDTLLSYTSMNLKAGPPSPLNTLQLRPIDVPPPVFFASIEPQSLSDERPVAEALAMLLREDPSLQLSIDEDSGQTLLSGMGELHLEIAKDRLIRDFKAKATMGNIEIGYRECILSSTEPKEIIMQRDTAGRNVKAGCISSVRPLEEELDKDTSPIDETSSRIFQDGNLINISIVNSANADEGVSPINCLPPHLSVALVHTALRNGAFSALARGPQHSFALHTTHVSITLDVSKHIFETDTTSAALSTAARLSTQSALKASTQKSSTALMEPVMNVIISVDEASLGPVVHDISSSRGGHIVSLDDEDVISATGGSASRDDLPFIDPRRVYAPPDPFASVSVVGGEETNPARDSNRQRSITARVPLKEMVGYLKHLRSLTGGRGTFVMSVDCFEKIGSQREKSILKAMRGA